MKWYYKLVIAFIISIFSWSIDLANMRFDYYPITETLLGALITWLPIFIGLHILVWVLDFLFDVEKPKPNKQK